MKKTSWLILTLGILLGLSFSAQGQAIDQFKVMVFSKTDGFHHESINEGVTALRALAQRHQFALDWHEDAGRFNDRSLEQYHVIIFLNTTGNILDDDQQAAMERFIRSGKGFVGIHSASDTEYEWEWYTKMVGRTFHIHPANQTAELVVLDRKFPGVERMPDRFLWTDEWYEFGAERIKGLNYILAVDEKTYDPKADWGRVKGTGMGDFHPISWYHNYDGGRAFYTALGHIPATFSDPLFMEHIFGGIYWAATGKGLKK
jgi:type 1 glutamine amidotransferase